MEAHSLLDYLSQITDFRIKKGQRHPLHNVLGMTIMATLSGRKGPGGVSRFVLQHKNELITLFDCAKHGVPSYGTLRTILTNVAFEELNKALFKWVNYHAPFAAIDFASADGKALCSTVTDVNNSQQNFIYLVTIYGTLNHLIYSSSCNEMQKDNEVLVVRDMFTAINNDYKVSSSAVGGRFDALYCQKK